MIHQISIDFKPCLKSETETAKLASYLCKLGHGVFQHMETSGFEMRSPKYSEGHLKTLEIIRSWQ